MSVCERETDRGEEGENGREKREREAEIDEVVEYKVYLPAELLKISLINLLVDKSLLNNISSV